MQSSAAGRVPIVILALALVAGSATGARAQGFVSPFIGYDFGGDSGCLTLMGCEDKKLNAGVALGSMRSVVGFEQELSYAKDFFGEAPGLNSSVITIMSNLMVAPKIGPVRPYVLGGVGLIRTHVSLTAPSALTVNRSHAGWDFGGGVMGFFSPHLGIRGEIRRIHAFQDLNLLGFTLSNTKLDFGRASAALVLMY